MAGSGLPNTIKTPRRARLSSRIVAILVCAAVLPMFVVILFVGELAGTALLDSRLESLAQVAKDSVARATALLESARADVRMIGLMGTPSQVLVATDPTARAAALDRLAAEVSGLLGAQKVYRSFILLDAAGHRLLRVDWVDGQSFRLAEGGPKGLFEPALTVLAPGQANFVELALEPDGGTGNPAAVTALFDAAGRRLGALVLVVAPSAVRGVFGAESEPEGVGVLLVDPDGRAVSVPAGQSDEGGLTLNGILGASANRFLGREPGVALDVNGYALAHATVPWDEASRLYWKVVAFIPRQQVLLPVRQLEAAIGGLALGLLALSLAVGLQFSRSLVITPFRDLLAAMRRFRDGELGARAVPHGGELGELAATFNDMAGALAQNRLALESQVAERTEALKLEIVERRKAQATLADALEAMQESFIAFDSDDRLVLFNTQATRLFGPNADLLRPGIGFEQLLRGLVARKAIPVAIDQAEAWVAQRMAQHRQPRFFGEFQSVSGRWFETREWRSSDGGSVSISAEITERKAIEARMAHSSKLMLLGELSAGLAHEITQPLNVIRLTAEATLARIDGDSIGQAETRSKLQVINEQADRLFDVIDYMQAFSRRESERRELFDLFASLRAAIALLDEPLRQRRITIRAEVPAQPCVLLGHPRQIEQVVINLLTNARDAIVDARGAAGGQIVVAAWRDEVAQDAGFRVDDQGGGVPVADRVRIFEPFFSTKGPGKGTGLGLSISYGIVSGMDGVMTVDDAPDGGARFLVRLPLSLAGAAEPSSGDGQQPARVAPPARQQHVMLVEDEPLAAGEMADFLRRCGYRVTSLDGGQAALAAFIDDPADLLVTDLNMPGGSGRELIDALLADYPHLPIIVVTGRSITKGEDLEEVGAGADLVLRKPIRLRDLAQNIERLLS
jgi:signal transduction histidine kinase